MKHRIVPPNEARGMYVHTAQGIKLLADLFPKESLREDQLPPYNRYRPRIMKRSKN